MAGLTLQKLGLGSSTFATFKPTSGPYDREGVYESRKGLHSIAEQENRFIFDAEPDGPLSPDKQPDLVPSGCVDNTTSRDSETAGGSEATPESCRHYSLYGQHKQPGQTTVNRVSNI